MKRVALLLGLVPALANASDHRGWLTGAGLALAGAGVVTASLGGYDAAQGDAARHAIAAYYAHGAAPTAAEAPAVKWLQERSESMGSRGLALLVAGGAAAVFGIALVVFDGWGPVSVSPGAASVVVSGTF